MDTETKVNTLKAKENAVKQALDEQVAKKEAAKLKERELRVKDLERTRKEFE